MILQALTRYYEDLRSRGEIAAPGWAPAKISFALCLNGDGELTQEDYDLRVLTFEDEDYKGGDNFAGGTDWSSLIDDPQYGGKLLYGSGNGVTSEDEAYKWTDENNTWLHNVLSQGYGSWCYWSGGHAISNYVSSDIAAYGGFESQLTVYKVSADAAVSHVGGGHNGSNNFAVHYGYADNSGYGLGEDALPALTFADGAERVIDHMYVTNTTYALNCYIDGNGLTANIYAHLDKSKKQESADVISNIFNKAKE